MTTANDKKLQKAIEKQREIEKYLAEVDEYFKQIGDESFEEDDVRNEYWEKRELEGNPLPEITKDAKGNEIHFLGNTEIVPAKCALPLTQDHIDEYTYCAYHPIYTIKRYFKIVSEDRGVIPFDLYDYQVELVQNFFKYNRNVALQSRQSGKCVCGDTKITTITTDMSFGKKILYNILKIIPKFFECVEDNESVIKFNDCSTIKQKILNFIYSVKEQTITDFINSSGINFDECSIFSNSKLKFIGKSELKNWYVKSDCGFVRAKSLLKTVHYKRCVVKFEDDMRLNCADEHILIDENGKEKFVKNIRCGTKIKTINGDKKVLSIMESNSYENMYDFELEEYHLYYTNGVLSHNTTTVASCLLFYCIFNKDKTVGIVSLKKAGAIEVLDRIKTMYLNLPTFLKPGVVKWNNGSVEFANGNKIICSSPAANSLRGRSIGCVVGESEISVRSEKYGIETITMNTMKERLNNTFNLEKQIYYKNTEYEILTPDGFQHFDGLLETLDKDVIKLVDYNLICTPDHKLKIDGNFVEASSLNHEKLYKKENVYDIVNAGKENVYIVNNSLISHNCMFLDEIDFITLKMWESFYKSIFPVVSSSVHSRIMICSTPMGRRQLHSIWQGAITGTNNYHPIRVTWRDVPGRDEAWREKALADLGGDEMAFRQEYEVEFLGSSIEYISYSVLEKVEKSINLTTQIVAHDDSIDLNVFEQPLQNHEYCIAVDVSEGKARDYSTAIVIDITQMPLKVVASMKNNKLDPLDFAPILYDLGMKYNEAFLMIENNFSDLAKDMWYNYEYMNMFTYDLGKGDHKQPKKMEIGLHTTTKTRKIGEAYFKHLVVNEKIILNDIRIVRELNNLQWSDGKKRFEPRDENINDDLWSAMKTFSYIAKSQYFENMIRSGESIKSVFSTSNESVEDPLPFIIKPVIISTVSSSDSSRKPYKPKVLDDLEKKWESGWGVF